MAFAKLYETGDGQILVKIGARDDGCPEVKFYAETRELGVCATSVIFEDCEEGWHNAEDLFERTDERLALAIAKSIFRSSGH